VIPARWKTTSAPIDSGDRQLLDPARVGVGPVEADHVVAAVDERFDQVTSDEPCTAGDDGTHGWLQSRVPGR